MKVLRELPAIESGADRESNMAHRCQDISGASHHVVGDGGGTNLKKHLTSIATHQISSRSTRVDEVDAWSGVERRFIRRAFHLKNGAR